MELIVLAKAGFSDLSSSRQCLLDLAAHCGRKPEELLPLFADAASPDEALRSMLQLAERQEVSPDYLLSPPLIKLAGVSPPLFDYLLSRPQLLAEIAEDKRPDVSRAALGSAPAAGAPDPLPHSAAEQTASAAPPESYEAAADAIKAAYRRELIYLVLEDIASERPLELLQPVSERLADLAQQALRSAYELARFELAESYGKEQISQVAFLIVGMGKTGARELNYLSDVDLLFVVDNHSSLEKTLEIGTKWAQLVIKYLSTGGAEAPLWPIDANLRPEGRNGPLVRTLSSYVAYYEKWAQPWEFQALLKARPLAGDAQLGDDYQQAMERFIWRPEHREQLVHSTQSMRRRVIDNIPRDEREYQLKLGPGGIRDIEFTVQLFQLVHGVHDSSIRAAGTLEAIDALRAGGYIARTAAVELAHYYRCLRLLEHRIQLFHLRREHFFPQQVRQQKILARSARMGTDAQQLVAKWKEIKQAVSGLYQRLFYHPLLNVHAKSAFSVSHADSSLSQEEAKLRLLAIGFRDPERALGHIDALTRGSSRKAAVYRVLMPVFIQWLSESINPDQGLLRLRVISEKFESNPRFLRMLRDSYQAARNLIFLLSASSVAARELENFPDAAHWLDQPPEVLFRETYARRIERVPKLAEQDIPARLRSFRKREVLRNIFAQMLTEPDSESTGRSLSELNDEFLKGIIRHITPEDFPAELREHWADYEFAIVGMGRYGGLELNFSSDLDVMYVYRHPDAQIGAEITSRYVKLVNEYAHDEWFCLDTGLRPEGRNGPVFRSFAAYAKYYEKWSELWEAQALLRCRAVAGSAQLLDDFIAMVDPLRYRAEVTNEQLVEIKRIKARVENERVSGDAARHLKLGPGTLSDIEWLVQCEQLKHAAARPDLRAVSTLQALDALEGEGIFTRQDAAVLRSSWRLISGIRNAIALTQNRASDHLPTGRDQLNEIAYALKMNSGHELEERFLAHARRSRKIFERLFYDR